MSDRKIEGFTNSEKVLQMTTHLSCHGDVCELTIFSVGAAILAYFSLFPFLNATTLIINGCFLYCDFILRPP